MFHLCWSLPVHLIILKTNITTERFLYSTLYYCTLQIISSAYEFSISLCYLCIASFLFKSCVVLLLIFPYSLYTKDSLKLANMLIHVLTVVGTVWVAGLPLNGSYSSKPLVVLRVACWMEGSCWTMTYLHAWFWWVLALNKSIINRANVPASNALTLNCCSHIFYYNITSSLSG